MNLQQWDTIAPVLASIEDNASWIAHYAQSIKPHTARLEYAMRYLAHQPAFETKARDQIEQAIRELSLTLALCRSALEAYDAKPIHLQAAE